MDIPSNSKRSEDPCSECKKKTVVLFIYPHKLAGVYSCELDDGCGASWSCEHENFERGTGEVDTMRNGEHDTYEVPTAECTDCEQDVTEDVGDPEDPND